MRRVRKLHSLMFVLALCLSGIGVTAFSTPASTRVVCISRCNDCNYFSVSYDNGSPLSSTHAVDNDCNLGNCVGCGFAMIERDSRGDWYLQNSKLEAVASVLARGDAEELRLYLQTHSADATLNVERQAIQVKGCGDDAQELIGNIPISPAMVAALVRPAGNAVAVQ